MSLVFTHMTAYQLLHRTARVKSGRACRARAACRWARRLLELGAVAGLRMYGTCSARDFAAVERLLGAVAIDYRHEDFLARVRELTGGEGVDVVLEPTGSAAGWRFAAPRGAPAEDLSCSATRARLRT